MATLSTKILFDMLAQRECWIGLGSTFGFELDGPTYERQRVERLPAEFVAPEGAEDWEAFETVGLFDAPAGGRLLFGERLRLPERLRPGHIVRLEIADEPIDVLDPLAVAELERWVK